MTLNVGHITYANCAPFFHYLPEFGFDGKIVAGVPAELNRQLASGDIDVSPSSSFEYARNWRQYLLLPGQSISSFGPVKSVLLFSERPLEELDGVEITLTGESATSIHLLQIILREFFNHRQFCFRIPRQPVEEVVASGRPALLIGDRALRAAMASQSQGAIHDLGELWYRFTGLPFVFALWILRCEAAEKKRDEVRNLIGQLSRSRQQAFASLDALAADRPERQWFGEAPLVDYWQTMSYDLTEEHIRGLKLFFELACKYEMIPDMPEIRFFS